VDRDGAEMSCRNFERPAGASGYEHRLRFGDRGSSFQGRAPMRRRDFHHDPMVGSARTAPVYMSTWHECDMRPYVSLSRIDTLPQEQVRAMTVEGAEHIVPMFLRI